MNVKKAVLILLIGILSVSLVLAGCGSKLNKEVPNNETNTKTSYPLKSITLVNYMPELKIGPTAWTKEVMQKIGEKMGQKINVTSEPAEQGAKAVKQVWNAPHDGYSVVGITENFFGFGVLGLTKQTSKDWVFFEIGQVPSILVVSADSPYKTINELVEAAKKNPNKIKVGNTGKGRTHDLKTLILEKVSDTKFVHVPFPGGVGAADELLNKKIDALSITVPAVISQIKSGKIRPLVMTDLGTFDFGGKVGMVDSITNFYPETEKYFPLDGATGLAMPANTPKEVINTFGKTFEEVMGSPEMEEYFKNVGVLKLNLKGKEAQEYVTNMESNMAWLIKDMGIAKNNPEELGIKRPQWK